MKIRQLIIIILKKRAGPEDIRCQGVDRRACEGCPRSITDYSSFCPCTDMSVQAPCGVGVSLFGSRHRESQWQIRKHIVVYIVLWFFLFFSHKLQIAGSQTPLCEHKGDCRLQNPKIRWPVARQVAREYSAAHRSKKKVFRRGDLRYKTISWGGFV